MMQAVKGSLEDADVALLIVDVKDNPEEADAIFSSLHLKVPALVVLNKVDTINKETIEKAANFFSEKNYCKKVITISALKKTGLRELLDVILFLLPEGEPFYHDDNLSDLPTKFFVSEIIREKIFQLYSEEIPYHATVLVQEIKEKTTLTKI